MTAVELAPVPERTTDAGDGLDHACCCADPAEVGDQAVSFCGKVEEYTGTFPHGFAAEPNPCVVCLALLESGYCPRLGRCPWADEP